MQFAHNSFATSTPLQEAKIQRYFSNTCSRTHTLTHSQLTHSHTHTLTHSHISQCPTKHLLGQSSMDPRTNSKKSIILCWVMSWVLCLLNLTFLGDLPVYNRKLICGFFGVPIFPLFLEFPMSWSKLVLNHVKTKLEIQIFLLRLFLGMHAVGYSLVGIYEGLSK